MNFKFRFTIFTPCYNSEKFIHRVTESLESQSFHNFEWLVINDASSDNTRNLIENYAKKSTFPIRIINNTENKMLYYNFNLAFEEAQGELMIFAGHDDRFHSETLEIFDKTWRDLGNEGISGISCLCQDQNGSVIGKYFSSEAFVSNYFDMYVEYLYRQERFGCTRTDILKKFKFDLKGGRIGEGFLWERIGMEYRTIYLNKVLRTYYREADNVSALTKSSRKKVALPTYISYLDWVNLYLKKIKGNIIFKLRFHFAFIFYGLILKHTFSNINNSVKRISSKFIVLLFFPFAFLLYSLMRLFNKI